VSTSASDALVLVLPAGRTLEEWRGRGTLGRERALLDALRDRYARIVMVTHGADGDLLAAQELRTAKDDGLFVVPTMASRRTRDDERSVAAILDAIGPCAGARVLVQTMQLDDGGISAQLMPVLRTAGVTAALVARGGYLPSRVLATEQGPHTAACVSAGAVERRITRIADAVMGVTPTMLDDLAWRYGVDPATTFAVPNYVLAADQPATADQREALTIVTRSALVPRKRVDHLVRAAAALRDNLGEGFRLDVLGEGPLRMNLTTLAEELKAPVQFLGHRPHEEVLARLRTCSAFVLASSFETNPRPLLEAMAEGAPVIVANSPGLAEHIENGVSGVIVPGSPESFAYALTGVLPDPDWRNMLGASASQTIAATCSLQRVVDRTLAAHDAGFARAASKAAARKRPAA